MRDPLISQARASRRERRTWGGIVIALIVLTVAADWHDRAAIAAYVAVLVIGGYISIRAITGAEARGVGRGGRRWDGSDS